MWPYKERDPVNWSWKSDPWRSSVFEFVARLIRFRKRSSSLGVNDTSFIHTDFSYGRKIMAWLRRSTGMDGLVVAVANFSDAYTPGPEYVVNNWPDTPPGCKWREVSQDTQYREILPDQVGKEPLYPWEAKVYEAYSS